MERSLELMPVREDSYAPAATQPGAGSPLPNKLGPRLGSSPMPQKPPTPYRGLKSPSFQSPRPSPKSPAAALAQTKRIRSPSPVQPSPQTAKPPASKQFVEPAQSRFAQTEFSVTDPETEETLNFAVLLMRDSVLVWGGSGAPRLGHMATAIQTKWEPMPVSTTVLGKVVYSLRCLRLHHIEHSPNVPATIKYTDLTPPLGQDDGEWIEPFASKLAKRLGCVLHLSLNFGTCSFEKQLLIQKSLAEKLPAAMEFLQNEARASHDVA